MGDWNIHCMVDYYLFLLVLVVLAVVVVVEIEGKVMVLFHLSFVRFYKIAD